MMEHSQLTRFGLFDSRVPRYTSYPTAPQFSGGIGPAQFAEWIAAIAPGSKISLYLHVPFCRRLCWFCACRTQGTSSDAPVVAYVETLLQEIALLRQHLPRDVTLARLHWGGGTPTLLPGPQMERLAKAIFDVVPLDSEGEFSVEIDPNEIDADRLDALVTAGMNRASIGVQDFDPEIQRIIGREQDFELTRDVAQMIRTRGVASLNADILFGLPGQTNERLTDSVAKLIQIRPDRVALYGYAHVPWMSRRQNLIPSDLLPTPHERLGLFETATEMFEAAGYAAVGIDHFALPEDGLAKAARAGRLRRNFQGYTDDAAPVLIGLGASSISRFPQGYAQNTSGTAEHAKSIRAGSFSTGRGHEFHDEDRIRGRIIESLMCDFAVDRAELIRDFNISPAQLETLFQSAVQAFPGVLDCDDLALRIPPGARALTRMIARSFDAYDPGSKARHSAAI